MYRTVFALAFSAVILTGCGGNDGDGPHTSPDASSSAGEAIPFREDGHLTFLRSGEPVTEIAIEIADSDSSRQRGLMQRTSLPEQSGMLFVFEREDLQSFWMSNTPLALDLIFVNRDSQIVDIDKYARPFSPDAIASDEPAQYVVEVPAGFADMHGLIEGERITWTRTHL